MAPWGAHTARGASMMQNLGFGSAKTFWIFVMPTPTALWATQSAMRNNLGFGRAEPKGLCHGAVGRP